MRGLLVDDEGDGGGRHHADQVRQEALVEALQPLVPAGCGGRRGGRSNEREREEEKEGNWL